MTCEFAGCVHICTDVPPGLGEQRTLFSLPDDGSSFERHITSDYHRNNVNKFLRLTGSERIERVKRECHPCEAMINVSERNRSTIMLNDRGSDHERWSILTHFEFKLSCSEIFSFSL
ncbi:unnamed protein product [Somion occarium]|uniref:Uncharacterized protein n=1 Tax=Somion occarium TaxID=3059160 RepID=A0ABP1D7B4_9APHY